MYEDDEEKNLDKESDDERIVCHVYKKLKESQKHLATSHTEMSLDYGFFSGDEQWTEQDKLSLQETQRAPIVFNRLPRIINAVSGLEVQNRQEVKILPRRVDVSGFAETYNGAIKWARENCDAEDEDSQAFNDCLICGFGVTETRMDYEENSEGDIKIDRIDPLEFFYDPTAKKKNLVDAKWVAHRVELTKEEAKEYLGDDYANLSSGFDFGVGDENVLNHISEERYLSDSTSKTDTKKIYGVKFQEYVVEHYYKAINPFSGQIETIEKDAFEELKEKNPMFESIQATKLPRRVYWQYFIIGQKLVEKTELICADFTFKTMTGLYNRNKNTFFGLIRLMRDPQMWQNKWLSQILHIINTNSKGGLLAEKGAFVNKEKAMQDWAKSDTIIELNPGALTGGKIKEKIMPPYPEGIDRLMQYAQTAINDVSGVSMEFLGLANREQPYALEYNRQKQGILILAPFFDSARRYRKVNGRLLAKYIREYISDGRLVRIAGQEGYQYVPLIRDELNFEYDIVVDDAPSSPNMKQHVFEVLMQIIPIAMQAGIQIPPEVLDYAPLPESLSMKWKQMIMTPDPTTQQLNQLKLVLAQLEAQGKELDNQKTSAEVQKTLSEIPLNAAKAEQAAAIGQDETAQAAQKMGLNQHEMQMKEQKLMIDQSIKTVEMLLNQKRKMVESQMNAKIKSQHLSQQQSNY